MPWIDQNKCIGCELCVNECPVNAIFMQNGKANINMDKCIRCGKCHEICSQQAVRHDSEKISQEIEKNYKKIIKLMNFFKTKEEKKTFLERMIKHFNKKIKIAEKTIEKINILKNNK